MSNGLTTRHHVVYYTFFPMLILTFGAIFSSPALWYFDILPIMYAFLLPWVAIFGASVYLMIFGDHVIPSETYRKVRSGEWEYNE